MTAQPHSTGQADTLTFSPKLYSNQVRLINVTSDTRFSVLYSNGFETLAELGSSLITGVEIAIQNPRIRLGSVDDKNRGGKSGGN